MLQKQECEEESMTLRTTFSRTVLFAVIALVAHSVNAAPTITVWYGANQSFGQLGNPQTAINILGNVSDPNGIQSLSYTLNGGSPVNLSRGPDSRRLLRQGDFNIDIYTTALNNGTNTIVITARNNLNETSTETVTVQYTAGQVWPHNYSINWNSATSINSVAQVVDGHWTLQSGIVKPTYLGYDRIVAIGSTTWTDYEVTVPITMRGIDPGGFGFPGGSPGVGLLFRWTGHTDNPISGAQPKTGYLPFGAIAWYAWENNNPSGTPRLKLVGNNLNTMQEDFSGLTLSYNVTYIFKMRVETIPGQGGVYKFKVWQQGQPEPSTWRLQGQSALTDPQSGSPCLLSHHVDAEFGNVTITPLAYVNMGLKAFLEGPYNSSTATMRTDLQPVLPAVQPYTTSPWSYVGVETIATIPSGAVDWVLLELRTGTASSTRVATRAALIKSNGVIVELDGSSPVTFGGISAGNYYVVIRHRNHLPIMSASPLSLTTSASLYDFTMSQSQAYGVSPMKEIVSGVFGMIAGDANSTNIITASDANGVFVDLNATNYNANDANMNRLVTDADANVVFQNINRSGQLP